jgi:malonyl-CoA O-methyltransferase
MQAAYDRYREAGRLPATYEVVFGQAWAPLNTAPRRVGADAHVSLEDVKRQLATSRDS